MKQEELNRLVDIVLKREEWLMKRILHYAKLQDYTRYTSTLVEPWRLSIAGLSKALADSAVAGRTDLELSPDENLASDVIADFAVLEARLHRKRGVSLSMFLGLMKYYRQSYLDLLDLEETEDLSRKEGSLHLHRFFDRLEIAFCVEWSGLSRDGHVVEMENENLRMTNEKNLYLTALESLASAIIIVDKDGLVREINGAAHELFYQKETSGHTYYQNLDLSRLTGSGSKQILNGIPLVQAVPWLRPLFSYAFDGEKSANLTVKMDETDDAVYIRISLTPMLDISDKFQGILVSMVDISYLMDSVEKLRKEQNVRKAVENRLRATLQAAEQIGLIEIAYNQEHTIIYYSSGVERVCGFATQEVLNTSFFDLLADKSEKELFRTVLEQVLDSGEPVSTELRLKRKNRSPATVLLSTQQLHDSRRRVSSFLSVITDITDRKNIARQLMQTEKLNTIAGLAAGVAHEINTPLSGILQSIQIIKESLDKHNALNRLAAEECGLDLDKMSDYFNKKELSFFFDGIYESATSASRIVRNLLRFSRPGDYEKTGTDINEIIKQTVELARSDYNLKKQFDLLGVRVEMDLAENLPLLKSVPQDIEQVLFHLIKNGIQAMAEQPDGNKCLTFRTGCDDGMINIVIEDTGTGMNENVKPHVFEPFYTTRDVGQGKGLGLSICHSIIHDQHNGSITIDSITGQGTRCTVSLPFES